ncbi:putative glycolipid-binding domain-containing protein [Spirillospora sp. NPDC052242]
MPFAPPPATAAWRHLDARTGFEVVRIDRLDGGWRLRGTTTAVEQGRAWAVEYAIDVDERWCTRRARVSNRLPGASPAVTVEQDEPGRWLVDGERAAALDGCRDVDLESSAVTNALPVHRTRLAVGESAEAPAVYVRAEDLAVDRLEQTYARTADAGGHRCYDYAAPAFGFTARLVYDPSGFVLEYPGLAARHA